MNRSDWEEMAQMQSNLAEQVEVENTELKAENKELKKFLKYARDDKAIRLKEIEVLEAKIVELRECDLCESKAEYRQCQSCMNDKFVGSHTDEEWHKLEAELDKFQNDLADPAIAVLISRIIDLEKREIKLRELVNKQAEDEGLWFDADYITEAYLQGALRKLHAQIEESANEIKQMENPTAKSHTR